VNPRLLAGLAAILAVACLWPFFLVFQWFGVNIATMERMTRTDPLGFTLAAALVMFLRPTLAALATLIALRASILAITSPPHRAFRILLPAAIVQVSLVLVILLTGAAIDRSLAQLVPRFEDRQTPGAIIAADFTKMQAQASAGIVPPLLAIAGACVGLALGTKGFR
jgi:hypothetical protein